ncbi:MAG: GntR family transcriptional regulator [Gallionellaceae bacterium]|nr:MAG: GntR family transcriptional regulator [Gallionellaceae bacterium]
MSVNAPHQGTLADIAAQRLAHSIITGEIPQGNKLNEAELAERFGMGRGPVREALRHLEGMRLVTYAVREALEGLACHIAAAQMTGEEILQLSKLLDSHEKQIEKHDGKMYVQSEGDFDFHYRIVRGSRNEMLMGLLGGEQYQLLRMCRYRTSRNAQRTRPALQQHRQIVEALAQRDGELAEMLMRRHIQGAWRSISELIDEEGKT